MIISQALKLQGDFNAVKIIWGAKENFEGAILGDFSEVAEALGSVLTFKGNI